MKNIFLWAIVFLGCVAANYCDSYSEPVPFDDKNETLLMMRQMKQEWCDKSVMVEPEDPSWKLQWLNREEYEKLIYDSERGFVGGGPSNTTKWMIWFIDHKHKGAATIRNNLQKLAFDYRGKVLFGVVTTRLDEEISLAYDVTGKLKQPRGFLIDSDGMAYGFDSWKPEIAHTKVWIDKANYKESPLQFRAQPVLSKQRLYWAYVKKDVRNWYASKLRNHLEPWLVKFSLTYFVDPNEKSMKGVVLN